MQNLDVILYCHTILFLHFSVAQFPFQVNFSMMFNHLCNLLWMGIIFPYLHMVKAVLAKHIHWYASLFYTINFSLNSRTKKLIA